MKPRTLLLSEIFPPQNGGSGRWFWELYTRLPHDDYAIAAGSSRDSEQFDQGHNLSIYRLNLSSPSWGIKSFTGLRFYWRVFKEIRAIIARENISMLHCGRCLPEGVIGYLLYKITGTPYLCYIHGEDVETASSSRELSWMVRRVLNNARQLISNSRNTEKVLLENWSVDPNKISVLNPGVDTNKFVPAEYDLDTRNELGWGDRPVILTVGRLQKRKGHDMMISALPEISKEFPGILYAIIGNGEERENLQTLAGKLGISDNVQFLDEISDSEMIHCYQQCNVFILPNRTEENDIEGFGMVLVEAQSCGKPVIAGDSGGTAETMIIGKTGYIIDCTQPNQIASTLIDLLSKPDKQVKFGTAGRNHTVTHLDWLVHVNNAVKIFKSMDL